MRVHLLEVLQKTLGTNGLTAIAEFLGDSPAKTEESFFVSVAVVLRDLVGRPKPGDIWIKLADNEVVDPSMVLDLAPQVIRSKMPMLCEKGTGLFAEVFGTACASMVANVSSKLACTPEKATSNLGLATIYTLSALRKWGDASAQPKQAVRNLLEQQKSLLGTAAAAPKKSSLLVPFLAVAGLVVVGYLAWPRVCSLIKPGYKKGSNAPLTLKSVEAQKNKISGHSKPEPDKMASEKVDSKGAPAATAPAVVSTLRNPPVAVQAASAAEVFSKMISSPDKAVLSTALSITPEDVLSMDKDQAFFKSIAELMLQKKEGSFQVRSHVYTEPDLPANQVKSRALASHIKKLLIENGVAPGQLSSVGFGSAIPAKDKTLQSKTEFRYLAPSESK